MTNKSHDAYERLAADASTKVDLWGPPSANLAEGVTERAPSKKHPWAAMYLLWTILALVASQAVLLAVLVVVAIDRYGFEVDTAGDLDQVLPRVDDLLKLGPVLVAALVLQWVVFVGMPVWATYRRGHRSIAKDFGFTFKVKDLPFGLAFAVAAQLLLMGLAWFLQAVGVDMSNADNTNQVTDQTGTILVLMILAATIGAPLTEELLFRGLILRACLRSFANRDLAPRLPGVTDKYHDSEVSKRRRTLGTVAAVTVASLLFGLPHAQDGSLGSLIVVGQTSLLGAIFTVIALKTRRLGVGIWMHFFFNSISLSLVFLT